MQIKIRNCTGKTVLYFQSPVVFFKKYFSLLILNQFLINEHLHECSEKYSVLFTRIIKDIHVTKIQKRLLLQMIT